ncbi:GNAT family N-acetyltransferase [Paenibacillus sp. J22TS3]|uniref:GNAT family N-acetyltransferase n=1 Tax=Paenibacillus sp. J22TS3 TaxID=2807192 RepID=UPI001B1C4F1E|nr:GNAT family N-acetyltransferase [Paenibacillus sp. J22TS3]GIP24378.1 hypothetical protein J22TS3_46530 [Paenibacillus sp. J22TS3]
MAFRLEASMLGLHHTPVLPETFDSLSASSEAFYGEISEDGDLLGAIAVTEEQPGNMMITRLMVEPSHLRQGIGSRLLEHVLIHNPHVQRFSVYAGTLNTPAVELYRKFGFIPAGARTVDYGVELTLMQREM